MRKAGSPFIVKIKGEEEKELPERSEGKPLFFHDVLTKPHQKILFIIAASLIILYTLYYYHQLYPFYNGIAQKLNYKPLRHFFQGWLPYIGRFIDLNDPQWRSFRSNYLLLVGCFVVFTSFSRFYKSYILKDQHPRRVIRFYIISGLLYIYALHGNRILFLLVLIYVNYFISRSLGSSRLNPILTWTVNIAYVFFSDYYNGFDYITMNLGFLNFFKGIIPSWQTFINVQVLRFISYNMDYYWMLNGRTESQILIQKSPYLSTVERHLPQHEYTFSNLLAYSLYPVLYLTGPIISFNSFVSQIHKPIVKDHYSFMDIIKKFCVCQLYMIGLEVFLHFCYVNYFTFTDLHWSLPPIIFGFDKILMLLFMWLKFFIIWSNFRCLALFDNIESPNNMKYPIFILGTFSRFWKNWHRSLHLWIMRYLYQPLGGKKWAPLTIWLIFLFVGLWHDLLPRWVCWALANCFFFCVEIAITSLFSLQYFSSLRKSRFFPLLTDFVGAPLDTILLVFAQLSVIYGFTKWLFILKHAFILFIYYYPFIVSICYISKMFWQWKNKQASFLKCK